MAMTIVWSHFHRRNVPGSGLSTNFLIVAPNIIVYQRLEKDFRSQSYLLSAADHPPEWRSDFSQRVILRGEGTQPDASGNLTDRLRIAGVYPRTSRQPLACREGSSAPPPGLP